MQRKLIIGTRGSPLALYQANLVKTLLGHESKIKIFKTSGDRITGDLKDFGGKGLFTKELEAALINEILT
jgi:hydroxymethylbilane synthase